MRHRYRYNVSESAVFCTTLWEVRILMNAFRRRKKIFLKPGAPHQRGISYPLRILELYFDIYLFSLCWQLSYFYTTPILMSPWRWYPATFTMTTPWNPVLSTLVILSAPWLPVWVSNPGAVCNPQAILSLNELEMGYLISHNFWRHAMPNMLLMWQRQVTAQGFWSPSLTHPTRTHTHTHAHKQS